MRNRLGDVDEVDEDEDEDEDVDAREASRTRASWFLYQRILSAEMRMNSFLGWSVVDCRLDDRRLDGRGEMTRAIVCVWMCVREKSPGWVGALECGRWLPRKRAAAQVHHLFVRYQVLFGCWLYLLRTVSWEPSNLFNFMAMSFVCLFRSGHSSGHVKSSIMETAGLGSTRATWSLRQHALGEKVRRGDWY